MTQYDDVTTRAVGSLPLDPADRRAVYNRARAAQARQLRSIDPPLPEIAIEAEMASLEEAIRRVEIRFQDRAAPPRTLDGRRSGVRTAIVCGIGLVVAVTGGILGYSYWGGGDRTASQKLRQAMEQAAERAKPAPKVEAQSSEPVPYVYLRQLVHYRSTNPAGTLVVDKAQRHLYVILPNVSAIRYGIALGGNCIEAVGRYEVSRKMDLPQSASAASTLVQSSGRVLYLDNDIRMIHGTDVVKAIGQSVGPGCFLLMPTDLAELYGRVPVGTRVVVN
jgi:lipoprotein-anchoring transpeptidase ErfK/SrfK